jgi:hypothetical protein
MTDIKVGWMSFYMHQPLIAATYVTQSNVGYHSFYITWPALLHVLFVLINNLPWRVGSLKMAKCLAEHNAD